MAQWPAKSGRAKERMKRMEHSHTVIPLNVVDKEGNAVKPGDYERILGGAKGWVEFKLEHRGGEEGPGLFRAFVERICVFERGNVSTWQM